MDKGKIVKVSGPLVVATGLTEVRMFDIVAVGDDGLMGEIIEIKGDRISIQVYEETTGIGPGDGVESLHTPLFVELGPGLTGSIYDGIQRPLDVIYDKAQSAYLKRGVKADALSRTKKWEFAPLVKAGETVGPGDFLGVVQETALIKHYIMVPPGISGKIAEIKKGQFTVTDTVCVIEDSSGKKENISMLQKWPVRLSRPYKKKLPPVEILSSGQRVIDTFFPIAKGGTACIPGPFGSGKTVVQHQLAKWAASDVIVYVGCGERGNEMTDVLIEFPELKDPKSGEPLIKRTVLIANTSNMPVSAREASVYTGMTIAEYYRDMGYSVALMADSTSRWAEALREMSGRLEEMPGEEGYPAYLGTRIAEFYERSGKVECLSSSERIGSLSSIGAVSPPGGDLSDPVVQVTLRIVKVFWCLEDRLAYMRHFPAINWLKSYSLYIDSIAKNVKALTEEDFYENRKKAMKILQEEASLEEIVRLVGIDSLSISDRVTLMIAKSIREDFLHQHAFDPQDSYTSLGKQYLMMKAILLLEARLREKIKTVPALTADDVEKYNVWEKISKLKFVPENKKDSIKELFTEIQSI